MLGHVLDNYMYHYFFNKKKKKKNTDMNVDFNFKGVLRDF